MRCNGGTIWTIYKESVMRRKVQKSPDPWVVLPEWALHLSVLEMTTPIGVDAGLVSAMNVVSVSEWLLLPIPLTQDIGDWAPWCLGFAWWLHLSWLRELGVVTIGGEGFETRVWKMWESHDAFLFAWIGGLTPTFGRTRTSCRETIWCQILGMKPN